MKLTILGSGASVSIPRPFCNCKNCSKARKTGIPWARTGPSLFLEDESILFDTPEEIRFQIERENIKQIKHVFYTHWHPDHTQGMRIFEHINFAYPEESKKQPINIYIPENAFSELIKFCSQLSFFESIGFIKLIKVKDRTPIRIGKVTITPLDFKRKDRIRYGYLVEQNKKKVIYAPCSIFDLVLDKYYENLDLFIMETGWFGDISKRAKLPKCHVWLDHISFEENLDIIRKVKPKKTILTHIDGTRHLKKDTDCNFLLKQEKKHKDLNLKFAYDGMKIKV